MGYTDRLQRLCALRGVDQAVLAERLGVSRSSISRILGGQQEPKLSLAYQLAQELGVTLDYLMDEGVRDEGATQLVGVSDEELTILRIVRRLGPGPALDRLLGVTTPGDGPSNGVRT